MSSTFPEFFEEYNLELDRLGCIARVAPPIGIWHAGSVAVISEDGTELGVLPDSIEPLEMVAVVGLLERSFARGLAAGQAHVA